MEKIKPNIQEKLASLPKLPGVYLMKNKKGKIIYVGKAIILRNRVRSYFHGKHDAKTTRLVKNIIDLDYIITNSERDAFILESNLIKKYKPKYNIALKDDKDYPFLCLTTKELFPKIFIAHQLKKDGNMYFGPYANTRALHKTLRIIQWLFPLRSCSRKIESEHETKYKRSCFNYHIGKCLAPCIGKVSKQIYWKNVNKIIRFLRGKSDGLIESLTDEMLSASKELNFELAAQIRDKIKFLSQMQKKQHIFFPDLKSRDIIGYYKEGNKAAMSVIKIIEGKLLNREMFMMINVDEDDESTIMKAFIQQYYADKLEELPYKIIVQIKSDDFKELNSWLDNKLIVPQKGDNYKLIEMAKNNAFNYLEVKRLEALKKKNRTIPAVRELKENLGLKRLPLKMVCFDISTIQGQDTVSSAVFFENGKPQKKNYRHFIMKTVEGQDDFASMKESLERYLGRVKSGDFVKPDLIVIDGGKGQLSSAYSILKDSEFEDIEMISLAKRIEEVFLPGNSTSIILPKSSISIKVLKHIRDESHRFAITFHRKRRSSRTLTSELDKIKGIGNETKFLLLNKFGSVEKIKKATLSELASVKGIGLKMAVKILEEL